MRQSFIRSVALWSLLTMTVIGCSNDKPAPPPISSLLEVSWRYSLMLTDTGVLRIKNKTEQPTPAISLHYKDQDSGKTMNYELGGLTPLATVEVGVLENGWAIEPNQVIKVVAPGYSEEELYFYKDTNGKMLMAPGYAEKKLQQVTDRVHKLLE